jgi:RimJ/RimL family protein N-acetyltransferase
MIDGDSLPTIPGRRIALRWLTPRDVPALFTVFADPKVMRYWSCPAYEREEQARGLLAAIEKCFAEKSLFQWGIARREDDQVIGTCTLSSVDPKNLRAELGYALGSAHWGQGIMAEALGVLLDFAFGELGLRRLEADVDPENAASIRALERLGFQREGYMRERWFIAGNVLDSLYFGLLKREWEALRSKQKAESK